MNHRLVPHVVVLAIVSTLGCTRAPETPFAVAAAVSELPELHQENMRKTLRRMFGTPSQPRLVLLEEEAERPDDEAEAAARPQLNELVKAADLAHGARVYQNRCAGCHGISGDGQGEAAPYLQPKPRDYRKATYKFTSTPYGARPAWQDLIRTIRRGAKGTSMPAFPWMTQEDLNAVVNYVMYLSMRGRVEEVITSVAEDYDEDEAIELEEFTDALESEWKRWETAETQIVNAVSAEPAYDEASVKLGRTLFIKSVCYQCHGADAEGQTEWLSPEFIAAQESAPPGQEIKINYDAWGYPAPAANITAGMLHGGRRPIDIYRRVYTGINGTPMPAFGQIFQEEPDSIWHLVHYVMHIVDGGDPSAGIGVADVMGTDAESEG